MLPQAKYIVFKIGLVETAIVFHEMIRHDQIAECVTTLENGERKKRSHWSEMGSESTDCKEQRAAHSTSEKTGHESSRHDPIAVTLLQDCL